MKIFAIAPGPGFSVLDVHNGWVEGLRACGASVIDWDLASRYDALSNAYKRTKVDGGYEFDLMWGLEPAQDIVAELVKGALYDNRPDLVLITSAMFTRLPLLDSITRSGVPVAVIHTESPYEDDRQIEVAEHATINLINDPLHIDRFPKATVYQPHCYRPLVHFPADDNVVPFYDFTFVGTGFKSRVEFFEAVDWSDIRPCFAGNWLHLEDDSPLLPFLRRERTECENNYETADLYRSSLVGANLYRKEANLDASADGVAMGPREVELAACGTYFARESRREGDVLFRGLLPLVSTPEGLRHVIMHAKENEDAVRRAGALAREVIADRTFENAAGRLLSWF